MRTMMSAVMDSLTHLLSSRRWPATRHRHSTAVNTQMDTTVVLLPDVPPTVAAATSASNHAAAAAAIDSRPPSASRPCHLFASMLLLPLCEGGFWRVAWGLGNGGARHGGTRGRVKRWCLRGTRSQEPRVWERILAQLPWYIPGPACFWAIGKSFKMATKF